MRLLIVDDKRFIRTLIVEEVKKLNCEIAEAENGAQALKMVLEFKPDIIILDVKISDMSGFEVCSIIRKNELNDASEQRIPIIFISADDRLEIRNKAFEAGGTEYITKPFIRGEILSAIKRIRVQGNELQDLTALVVDDNKGCRLLVTKVLEKKGANVIEAENGVDALAILTEDKNRKIDLVVLDYEMPHMDGVQVCKKIRQKLGRKNLPVLFLTALSDRNSIVHLFKAGATDYLRKPFLQEELFARLTVHLRKKLLQKDLTRMVQALKVHHAKNK